MPQHVEWAFALVIEFDIVLEDDGYYSQYIARRTSALLDRKLLGSATGLRKEVIVR